MGSDNGPSAKRSIGFERILLLTFVFTVFALAFSRNEPEVHHHYYDTMGEGQAYHHYGEVVASKTTTAAKSGSTGLRGPQITVKYDSTVPPSSGGSSDSSSDSDSDGSSTLKPGEDWEKDAPSNSESEDESATDVPGGYANTSTPPSNGSSSSGTSNGSSWQKDAPAGSESEDESATTVPGDSDDSESESSE